MDTKSCRIDPNIPLLTPPWEPPIKVLIQTQAIDMKEETTVDVDNSTTEIDLSNFLLDEIYIIQQAAAAELWLRQNVVSHQAAKHKKKDKLRKTLLQGKEREL